jgi:transcriptional regulator with XRE-family HTH domain
VESVAVRLSEVRKRKDMSAAEVGRRMTEQGVKWDRFTVANLENGKRQNITLTELLALACVLDVSPLSLILPLDDAQPYQVTPARELATGRVRPWLRGIVPLPGMDARIFHTEVPLAELGAWSGEDRPVPGED